MPRLGQFFDLFAQVLAAFPLAVGAIADEDKFSVVTHIRLGVRSWKYEVRGTRFSAKNQVQSNSFNSPALSWVFKIQHWIFGVHYSSFY